MTKVTITDYIDHNVMYEAEQVSYTPEIRAIWTREHYVSRRRGLPAIGFEVDGKPIGGVYMDHGFIHISLLPEFHGKWAFAYMRGLEWALSHADPIYASIAASNKKCIRYVQQSGWEPVGQYSDVVFYRSNKKLLERLQRRRGYAQTSLVAP